jgi:hypothetical protein
MPFADVFHRFVFRRTEMLVAGQIHQYQITSLRNLYSFQGASADPVMHIVAPDGTILAENDDFNGAASEIIFTPKTSGPATLIIRPFSTKTPGVCNLLKGLDGMPPAPLTTNLTFNGVTAFAAWNAGDVFQTITSTGDPMLFVRTNANTMFMDDDSGPGLNPRFSAPIGGVGRVILGSFSLASEGVCRFSLDPGAGEISLAFNLSERPDERIRDQLDEPTMTPQMERYVARLLETKETLEALEPTERDQKVMELQEELLSEDERRPMVLPAPQARADFVRLQRVYRERYMELERELAELRYEERAARIAELKTKIVGSP